jgi:hypothetical protein
MFRWRDLGSLVSWTPYASADSSSSVPILAGGLINTVGATPSSLYLVTMAPDGTLGGDTESGQNSQSTSNLIEDGTNIYVTYRDVYPREWVSSWQIGPLTFTPNLVGGPYYRPGFVVTTGGNTAMVTGGEHGTPEPSVATYDLPAMAQTGYNDYPAYTGAFGFAVFAAAAVYTVLIGTNNLFKIDPATLVETVFNLPNVVSFFAQLGFDGRYIYISDGTTIVIWDTSDDTDSTAGSVGPSHCYWSANLDAVAIAENVAGGANFYLMPAGGGALSPSIGNANTIVTPLIGPPTSDVFSSGLCDGPGGDDLWTSVQESTTPQCFNLVYVETSGNPMRLLL